MGHAIKFYSDLSGEEIKLEELVHLSAGPFPYGTEFDGALLDAWISFSEAVKIGISFPTPEGKYDLGKCCLTGKDILNDCVEEYRKHYPELPSGGYGNFGSFAKVMIGSVAYDFDCDIQSVLDGDGGSMSKAVFIAPSAYGKLPKKFFHNNGTQDKFMF